MKEVKIKNLLSRVQDAHSKYSGVIGSAEATIQQHSDFESSIEYQPSDGFVVVDDRANNAPLSTCVQIILEKGVLTHADYLKETI